MQEKCDKAIEHYCKVLEIDPSNFKAHLNLGNMFVSKGKFDEAVNHYLKVVKINPEFVMGYYNLGKSLVVAGRPKEGFDNLREAIRLRHGFVPGMKELAWFLATHPDPEVRDANEALRLAEQASELTGNRNPTVLDTLAAAYAARGQFSLAASVEEKALTFAERTQDNEFTMEIGKRLELYKDKKSFIQNPRERIKELLPTVSKHKSESDNENIEKVSL
jgi:tetratricopeptide (TPR) repeat protein